MKTSIFGFISASYLFLNTIFTHVLVSQTLPPEASKILDRNFAQWQIKIDSSMRMDKNMKTVWVHSQCLHKCNLNKDTLADYALVIQSSSDSARLESYVALVSEGLSYKLFTLYTQPVPTKYEFGLDFFCTKKGVLMTNFGFDEEENLPPELDLLTETFDVDCLTLSSRTHNLCTSYVFSGDRFWSFSSCD